MGWGDYIITAGLVRKFKTHNPNVQILIKEPFNETIYYKDIFYKNPYITHKESFDEKKPHIKIDRILVGKNDESNTRIIWSKERVAEVGNFYPKEEEVMFAENNIKVILDHWRAKNKKKPKGIIFISDTAKKTELINNKITTYSHWVNREWGRDKWEDFAKICSEDYILIKTSAKKEDYIDGLYSVICNFRGAYSIMEKCDFFIGNEGGFAHLWAITKKKGIVFFGHWQPPYVTGYPFNINLTINDNNHCGSLNECSDCINFLKSLEPEYIKYLVEKNI